MSGRRGSNHAVWKLAHTHSQVDGSFGRYLFWFHAGVTGVGRLLAPGCLDWPTGCRCCSVIAVHKCCWTLHEVATFKLTSARSCRRAPHVVVERECVCGPRFLLAKGFTVCIVSANHSSFVVVVNVLLLWRLQQFKPGLSTNQASPSLMRRVHTSA